MKVLLLFCLIAFALCDVTSTNNTCATGTAVGAGFTCPAGVTAAAGEFGWNKDQTIAGGATNCYTFDLSDADIENDGSFVLALRQGDDGNATSALKLNAVGNGASVVCVELPAAAVEDDFDFYCNPAGNFNNSLAVYAVNTNATGGFGFDFYVDYNDGASSGCTASYVSSSGSSIWLWVVIGVAAVLVVVVILAAVGGFIYMKKKKSSYQLYEDA